MIENDDGGCKAGFTGLASGISVVEKAERRKCEPRRKCGRLSPRFATGISN